LWIAKFPSLNDDKDMGGWEMVANELAKKSGLDIAEGMTKKINSKYHTFLTKRFDRTKKNERIHFASAMTLLGYTDGTGQEGASYLQLAEFLIRHGARVNEDLEELWRRIVFNISVRNTDDHLRNHGFLLTPAGWILSPAYDINPVEYGTGLTINISEEDNSLSLDLALEVAAYFRLTEKQTTKIIKQIKAAVATWRDIAKTYGISKAEQHRMSRAFEIG
jgi:serine/threonine-protein kinase HipA